MKHETLPGFTFEALDLLSVFGGTLNREYNEN
jgi:hypothetical protein